MSFEKTGEVILIVDDTPVNLQILFEYLNALGFRILIAENGEEALTHTERGRPDIILLDIVMPGMDGFETCRRLKENERTKDIPVIFMTALSDTSKKIKGFEQGAVDYVTKPFNQEEVMARIATHLTIQRQKDELSDLNQKLSEVNAEKDKFFSIIAHDLKEPFNGLLGGTSFLAEYVDDLDKKTVKNLLEDLNRTSKAVFNLLENLLNWSRIQTGRIQRMPRRISINKIVENNIALSKHTAKAKGIRLANDIKANTVAYADESMIEAVIRNLLANALKYTENGGHVQITAEDAGDLIQISLSDNGVGIEKEDIDKLFRTDIHHSTRGTAKEKGTGLGLILCREFVEKNLGKIWVESKRGKGTTFCFTLPGNETP